MLNVPGAHDGSQIKLRTQSNLHLLYLRPSNRGECRVPSTPLQLKEAPPSDKVIQEHPLMKLLSESHHRITDGQAIYQLVREYSFFNELFTKNPTIKFDLDTIFNLCTKLQLEVFKKGQVILREKQSSNNKMYLVIIGRVLVVKDRQAIRFDNYSLTRKEILDKSEDEKFIEFVTNNFGSIVNELGPGNYFGEKAILEDQKKNFRSASCIASSKVYLITLHREDFQEVLKLFKSNIHQKRLLFDRVIPMFDQIVSSQVMENIMYSFREEVKSKDDHLIIEGQQANFLYILWEGEVALLKKYNNSQLMLVLLNQQELIGEESLFNNKYDYTVIVKSQEARILKVGASSFQLRTPGYCLSSIKELLGRKNLERQNQYKTIIDQIERIPALQAGPSNNALKHKQRLQAYRANELINLKSKISKEHQVRLDQFVKEKQPFEVDTVSYRTMNSLHETSNYHLKLQNTTARPQLEKMSELQRKVGQNEKCLTEESLPYFLDSSPKSLRNMSLHQPLQVRNNVISSLAKTIKNKHKRFLLRQLKFEKDSQLLQVRCAPMSELL